MAAWGRWGRAWEFKFIKDEVKVVWPFLAGFGLWNYLIYSTHTGLERPAFEGSKFYQRNKWRDIKNQKQNLEEALARASGTMKELDMESYCRFADKCWNHMYWNDQRPEWNELRFADGTFVEYQWPGESVKRPTFAEHRKTVELFAPPDKSLWDKQDAFLRDAYAAQAHFIRSALLGEQGRESFTRFMDSQKGKTY